MFVSGLTSDEARVSDLSHVLHLDLGTGRRRGGLEVSVAHCAQSGLGGGVVGDGGGGRLAVAVEILAGGVGEAGIGRQAQCGGSSLFGGE